MLAEHPEPAVRGCELIERIGEGGYGAVYRAYQPQIGRDVAVKIILPQYANHPVFIRRFDSEAQFVARLEHPYIVPLYDYWREPSGAFLIMRYLRGGSLHDLLGNGPLASDMLNRLLDQIGGALALAHQRGVVHRDLKPANILLDEAGNTYLADFGIAKELGHKVSPYQTDQTSVVGSPAYISPEQVKSAPVTPQTDIYSLGVMLYEILTGQLPFDAPTPIALMFKHVNEHVPPVRARRPDLSEAVNAVIQRATAKNPADRYPDVPALIRDLKQALAQVPATTQRLEPLAPPRTITPAATGEGRTPARSIYETGQLSAPALEMEPIVANPYKGLRAFQEADAADFFGRDVLTQTLLARMQESGPYQRFLTVVGPSGSGKSSVVRAGLVPALKRGALPGSQQWYVLELFPGAHPLEELAQALLRIAVDPPNNLVAVLKLDDQGLLRAVDQIVPGGDESEVVLVIDQFEELFTLVEDEAVRVHFLDTLISAVTAPDSKIRVVATLRADFYDRPLLYPGFSELVRQRTEVVVPLTENDLKAAIVGPAERNGLRVDGELVEAIVSDVGAQPGALPLLQYALTEVFARRSGRTLTLTPYHASGGVVGALARRADEIYSDLPPVQQEAARQLFLRLITLGEGVEDTRRRVRRSEILSIDIDTRALDAVIDQYARFRLLTLDHDPITRAPTVEVAHEALIRTWQRLRTWLDTSREDVRLQRRIAAAASEWLSSGREPSFLARGQRLAQFEAWAKETALALNSEERDYVDASLAERAAQHAAEDARKAHEALLERRSRTFLRMLAGVLAVAAIVAIGLSVVAVKQRQAAQQNALQAEQSAQSAATAEAQAKQNADAASAANAQALQEAANAQRSAADAQGLALANGAQVALNQGKSGNADLALTLALAASRMDHPVPQAYYTLSDAAYRPGTRRLFDGGSRMWAVAVSPDGKTAITAARDKTLTRWDLTTGAKLTTYSGHTGTIRAVAFSPDGASAVSAAQDHTAIIWDVASGKPKFRLTGHTDEVHAVAFSPDGATVLTGSDDQTLILWDAKTGAQIRQLTGHVQPVSSVAYNPTNSRQAISGSDDQTVILWDLETGKPLQTFKGPKLELNAVAFSPNGAFIVAGGPDKVISLWNVGEELPARVFQGHTQQINAVAISPDGKLIASGANDSLLGIWNAATGDLVRFLNVSGQVSGVAFTPRGDQVLTTSADGTMRLWDLANGAQDALSTEPSSVNRIARSTDGQQLLVGLDDHSAQLQRLDTGAALHVFPGHNDAVKDVAFSPDGTTIVSAANDGSMILWDLSSNTPRHILKAPPDSSFTTAAFSPDGKTLLSGGAGANAMQLWDVATGTEIISMTGHTDALNRVLFSPDGQAALSVSSDRTMILWSLAPGSTFGKQIRTFKGHAAKVRDAVFSRDGSQILSASEDRLLILWDVASGKLVRRFTQHSDAVLAVALSADGTLAASGSADNTVIVWDVASGRAVRRFEGHSGAVNTVLFSPDGTHVISGSSDGTVRQWRLDSPAALIAWATDNRYHPDLTCEQEQNYGLAPQHCA